MIEIIKISKSYIKKNLILDDISFNIPTNSKYCILGSNGAGKTTLLNIISQNLKQDSGKILMNSQEFLNTNFDIKRQIGFYNTEETLIDDLLVREYLLFIGLIYKMDRTLIKNKVTELMNYFVNDETILNNKIKNLSTGLRVKIKLISIFLFNPNILILDEPFANLDVVSCYKLIDFLNEYAKQDNNLVLFTTHDINYLKNLATEICYLNNKKVEFNGTYTDFLNSPSNYNNVFTVNNTTI